MGARSHRFLLTAVAATALAACSSGGDGGDEGAADPIDTASDADGAVTSESDASDDVGDETSDAAAGAQPVNGALVTVLDLGLGLYAVDRDSGDSFELSYEADWFTDRNRQPFVVGDRAYSLVFRQIEELDFVNEVALAEFDLTTGVGREVVNFGPERAASDSPEGTSWTLYGAGGDNAWLRRTDTNDAGESTQRLVRYSISTGDVSGEVTDTTLPVTTDEGSSCTFDARPLGVDPTGILVVNLGGIPGIIDDSTLAPTQLVEACFNPEIGLDTVAAAPIDEFLIVEGGGTVGGDDLSFFLDDPPTISNDSAAVTDDAIWWIFSDVVSTGGAEESTTVLIGGAAVLDRTTNEITAYPLGDSISEFLEPDDNGISSVSTLSQADLQVVGDSLWIMDWREEQPLRRVNTTSGEVTEIDIPIGDGNDLVEANLIPTDPEAVWLSVSRKVITSEEGEGRSTTGTAFVDQVDPATGEIVRSIPEADLTGFGN